MTTETATRTTNPAALLLVIGGVLSAIIGAILWATGNSSIGQDQLVSKYTDALIGQSGDATVTAAMAADQTMISWGIALVVLGVVMVLSWVIIRAARR